MPGKEQTIGVRFSGDEIRRLDENTKRLGVTRSAYIRWLVSGAEVEPPRIVVAPGGKAEVLSGR
jgi:hypothetical protein